MSTCPLGSVVKVCIAPLGSAMGGKLVPVDEAVTVRSAVAVVADPTEFVKSAR